MSVPLANTALGWVDNFTADGTNQSSCAGTFIQQLGVFDQHLPAFTIHGDVLV